MWAMSNAINLSTCAASFGCIAGNDGQLLRHRRPGPAQPLLDPFIIRELLLVRHDHGSAKYDVRADFFHVNHLHNPRPVDMESSKASKMALETAETSATAGRWMHLGYYPAYTCIVSSLGIFSPAIPLSPQILYANVSCLCSTDGVAYGDWKKFGTIVGDGAGHMLIPKSPIIESGD